MRDYYAILELPPSASQDMIREQYRFLIQAWHPDKFSNPKQKEKAEERTKLINEAYSVLNNPKKRAQYDSVRSTQSSSFRQEQRRQQAEKEWQHKQTEEAKRRTEYEQQLRKKAEEERQHKQAEETKRRAEYEQQRRKEVEETKRRAEDELQGRRQAEEKRKTKKAILITSVVLGIWMAFLCSQMNLSNISNQQPSSEAHQTILGQNTPKPTLVLGIVSTQVLATKTFSPTPDKRLILVDPQRLLLVNADLPPEAMYIVPGPEWISPQHNYETISEWGVEKGSKFVEETGRVDGWWIIHLRSNKEIRAPEQIKDSISMYETIEGAQLAITTFYKNRGLELGYTELDNPIRIGDISYALAYEGMQSNGKYGVEIEIFFSYRNYVHVVGGLGGEDDVTIGFVAEIAKILLRKLQAAPLSNP